MSRLNMRGSVASFVVVGAVLAALLLGSIYVVKTQVIGRDFGAQTEVAVETKTDEKPAQKTKDEQAATEKSRETSEEKPAETVTETPAQTKPDVTKSEEAAVEPVKDDETMPVTGVTVEKLPTTGPTETFGVILTLGSLAAAITYYRRSLRAKA